MRIFGRRREPDLTAVFEFDLGSDEIAVHEWWKSDGSWELLLHLPAVVMDRHLLTSGFLDEVEIASLCEFLDGALSALEAREPVTRFEKIARLSDPPERPDVIVLVRCFLDSGNERTWAEIEFMPPDAEGSLKTNVLLWVTWDWVIDLLEGADAHDEVASMIQNLLYQLVYYNEHLGKKVELGAAPFDSAIQGMLRRRKHHIAQAAGITVEEFDALPDVEKWVVAESHSNVNLPEVIPLMRDPTAFLRWLMREKRQRR